jgi:hypothetical protein
VGPAIGAGCAIVADGGLFVSAAPQSPQNRSPGSFCVAHARQTGARAAPHARQNRRDAAFSSPHVGQSTGASLDDQKQCTIVRLAAHDAGNELAHQLTFDG